MSAALSLPFDLPTIGPTKDTWRTPQHVIDLARALMGGIDTDPASNQEANRTVGATTYYTIHQDGLRLPWHGRVWCNPPYSKMRGVSQAAAFLARLQAQYQLGITTEGLLLTNVCTDTAWFVDMWSMPLCFVRGRLSFAREGHDGKSPKYANVLAYVGPRPYRFADHFSAIGKVVLP